MTTEYEDPLEILGRIELEDPDLGEVYDVITSAIPAILAERMKRDDEVAVLHTELTDLRERASKLYEERVQLREQLVKAIAFIAGTVCLSPHPMPVVQKLLEQLTEPLSSAVQEPSEPEQPSAQDFEF